MLSLLSLRRQIDAGSLTPRGAIALCEAAIDEREPDIRALVSRNHDPVVPERGPLAGIAVGVKDILDTADLPTQMGSPIYEGWRPRADAAAVARLRRLGAVPLAKTTTTGFAFLDPTQTRNPRHPGHTPGGSSAGSAAAVSAGMLPLALGTQTGGSVIRPAAYCGVVGMKPSFGLLPTVGMKCFSWTLDTLGLFTAGVADAAHALALMTGRPGLDLSATEPGTPRIGVVLQDFCAAAEPEALDALERVRTAAEAAGAHLRDVGLPAVFAEAFGLHGTIQDFEAAQALNWEYATHRADLGPLLEGGRSRPAAIARPVCRARRGRDPDALGARPGAGRLCQHGRFPLQPPLDADGGSLRDRAGGKHPGRVAARRADNCPPWRRCPGPHGRTLRRDADA
jgi:Asp-tRNA(Asn)/Glu-tRNA(Gln) amidotransferase A subunit family amidase